jgi:myo-inositol 2-dehydrogenase/D-chiro-inositol 1-dehydrogenase
MSGPTAAPVRIGLVGCGRLAQLGYVPALAHVRGAQLVAVADPDHLRRQRTAGMAAARGMLVGTHADTSTLVSCAAPDAVIVASPADSHVADARAAAAGSAALLVEKPPAPDVAGARALAAVTPNLWIGFNRRFDAGARRVRAAANPNGSIALHASIAYRRTSWAAHTVSDDALLDLGPHLVDWTRWIARREVVEVAARELSHERAVVDLTLDRGCAHLVACTDRLYRETLELRDSDGRPIARHRRGGAVGAVRGRLVRGEHPLVTTLAAQVEQLVRAVRGDGCADLATARDGAAVMTVIDAARASAARGGATVTVRRPEDP